MKKIDVIEQKKESKTQRDKGATCWLICFLLCYLGGFFGFHRFYAGKIGTGILYLFTLGLFGIGVIVDLFVILSGSFTNKELEYFKRP